jgi:uncharacterized membrane protein
MSSPASTERLRALCDAGVLAPAAFERALQLTLSSPGPTAWRRFVSAASLVLGAMLVLAGVSYFVAYNWQAIPTAAKFGILEVAIAGCALFALKLREGLPRQIALTAAAALIGPLLAVYGQVYQTGADPWGLFATWALMALPFAIAGRFLPLWVGAAAIADLALYLLWFERVGDTQPGLEGAILTSFAFGVAALVAFELAARKLSWARARWPARLAAACSLAPVAAVACEWVAVSGRSSWFFETTAAGPIAFCVTLVAVFALLYAYRDARIDLFMLSLGAGAAIALATTVAGRILLELLSSFEVGSLLISAMLVAEVAFAVTLLKRARAANPARE